MAPRGIAAVACLLTLACASTPPQPLNLDFEQGTGARGRPAGWTGGRPGYELAVDTVEKHGGAASVRITARDLSLADKQAAPLVQAIPAGVWRGKRVRLSGWLRTRGVSAGWAGLWMRVDSRAERNLVFDNMRRRGPRGTTGWARYEVVLDVPLQASGISFGVVLAGDGTVWADDLRLEVVPESVPTTEIPKPEQ